MYVLACVGDMKQPRMLHLTQRQQGSRQSVQVGLNSQWNKHASFLRVWFEMSRINYSISGIPCKFSCECNEREKKNKIKQNKKLQRQNAALRTFSK